MRITARVVYAGSAVVELALQASAGITKAGQIAANQQIPLKFLEQILIQLKNADIVRSIRGRGGGYRLARRPAEISLRDIVEAVEGSAKLFEPQMEADAALMSVWNDLEQEFLELLESISIEHVVAQKFRENQVLTFEI